MSRGLLGRTLVALVLCILAVSAEGARSVPAIEYYNQSLDHFFITSSDTEISALDSGRFAGWRRTGETFNTLDAAVSGAVPVCRIYMPPGAGDSHFYSASSEECDATVSRFPQFVLESSSALYVGLPNSATGACAADWSPLYRVWNNRADSNHRYTTSIAIRDQMVTKGYIAEGYGPDNVSMCAPPVAITPASPVIDLVATPATVVVPAAIELAASPTALTGSVQKVDFFVDSALLGTKTSAPWTLTYNAVQAGSLTMSAVATDSNGAKGYSNRVVVNAVAPPPPSVGPAVTIMLTQTAGDTFTFGSVAIAAPPATVASYSWDFGDGGTATTASVTHTYTSSGTFTVTLTVKDSRGATGTATKTLVATAVTPPPAPPPAPPPTTTTWVDRVLPSFESTNWLEASHALHSTWINPGGDWVDKTGVFNGPTPTISQKVTSSTVTIDISAIDGDLLLQGLQGWDTATIDGVAAVGFWVDPTSNAAQAPPARYSRPSMILNPNRGNTLVLTVSPNFAGQTVRVDKIMGPGITTLPMVNTGASAPNMKTLDPTSEAAVTAATGAGNVAQPWAYDTSVGNINGLPYLRFAITPANQRGISWFLVHTPVTEVYGRYCLYIEEDVALGMTELGVKLPGLAGDEVSWRMEHGAIAPRNPNVYAAVDYRYAADTGAGYGAIQSFNQMFRAGRWYVIEQYVKNNTFTGAGAANSDGLGKVWINGNLVWSSSTVKWNNGVNSRFNYMHVNVYHGGLGFPSQNIHYRIAGIALSTKYIGPPPQLADYVPPTGGGGANAPPVTTPPVTTPPPTTTPPTTTPPVVNPPGPPSPNPGSYPAWRQPLPMGVFSPIATTANMNGLTANSATVNAWNGFAASANTWFSALNGGHSDSPENKVMKIDLSAAAPKWTLLNAGSATAVRDALYNPDGLPASRHTYYTSQYVKSRNRLMMMGAPSVWGTGNTSGQNVDGFDLAANAWDASGAWPNVPFAGGIVGVVAKHPDTEDIYYGNNGQFAKWTMTTGLWSTFSVPGNPQWMFKPTLIDAARNRWVEASGQTLYFIDLATKGYTSLPITGMGATLVGDYAGMTHDLDNDRYVVNSAGVVFSVDPTTGAAQQIAILPVPTNGSSSRFTYFRDLGGIAYLPQFSSDILFMPTR